MLIGYVDVDYAGYLVDSKNTSGMAHFLGSCLISWASKKQNSIALSTTKLSMYVLPHIVLSYYGSTTARGL